MQSRAQLSWKTTIRHVLDCVNTDEVSLSLTFLLQSPPALHWPADGGAVLGAPAPQGAVLAGVAGAHWVAAALKLAHRDVSRWKERMML